MTEVALTFLVRKRCKSKINLHMSKKSCIFVPDFAMLKVRLHFLHSYINSELPNFCRICFRSLHESAKRVAVHPRR